MPNMAMDPLDVSEIIETFDPDDTRSMLSAQLTMLDEDACEFMTDNFKMLYTRFASIRQARSDIDSELYQMAEDRFQSVCQIFIEEVSKRFGFTIGEDFLDENMANIPSIALPIYLFFVVDFRSNIYNVLLSFINANRDTLAETFKENANKHDAITTVNKTLDDQVVALIASNIYDVIDWCMDSLNANLFFENMEKGYAALEPVQAMYDNGTLLDMDAAVDTMRDMLKTNVPLKARVGFDIVCRLKGFQM